MRSTHILILILLLSYLGGQPLAASFQAGSLLGKVTDRDGECLGEVKITLEGPAGLLSAESDVKGRFRFADLKPGNYSLHVESEGYSKATTESISIRLGRSTTVRVQLSESVDETIIVTSEPPVTPALSNATPKIIDPADIGQIPADRDPWASLDSVPGVRTEHTRRDGTANLIVPGTNGNDQRVQLDRTPGSATGALPLTSTKVEVIAGGDASVASAGVLINLVAPRNDQNRAEVYASAVDPSWQGQSSSTDSLQASNHLQTSNRIDSIASFGGDAGGQLLADKFWLWGSYQNKNIDRLASSGQLQSTELSHLAARGQGQLTTSNSAVLSYHRSDRQRDGVGAGLDRSPNATQLETLPSQSLRFEDTQLVAEDLYLSLQVSQSRSALSLVPFGQGNAVLDDAGVWQGAFGQLEHSEDTAAWHLIGDSYKQGPRAEHHAKFGVSHQTADSSDSETWGEDNLVWLDGQNFASPYDLLRVRRSGDLRVRRSATAFWVQDSANLASRWTLDYGFRYDLQQGFNRPGSVDSNPLFPDLLPQLDFDGNEQRVLWNNLSPRASVAYVIGDQRRTILRAGFGLFASQLRSELVGRINPLGAAEVLLGLDNGNSTSSPGFVILSRMGVDTDLPGDATHPSANDADLRAEQTRELRFSLEHHATPVIQLDLGYVRRRVSDVLETRSFLRDEHGNVRLATANDYRLESIFSGLLPDGSPWTAPVYGLAPGLQLTGGSLLANGDRSQNYESLTLGLRKRLSRGWMLRSHLTLTDWRWQIGSGFSRFDDPTDASGVGANGFDTTDNDGDIVTQGSDDRFFVNSRWSFDVTALYQMAVNKRWGFDVAAHIHGREGYPIPYTISVVADDGFQQVQVTPTDSYRLDDVYTVDLRLEKELRLGNLRATLSVDGFNLLDSGFVLARERSLNSPQADAVRENLVPRMYQIGIRFALD